MKWPGFTLPWLWSVARGEFGVAQGDVGLAQRLYEHAVAAGLRIMVEDKPVLLSAAGCVPTDAGYFETLLEERRFSGRQPPHWLKTWRAGVWRNLGYDFAGTPDADAPDCVVPARMEGFPVPDPIDGVLLESHIKPYGPSEHPSLNDILDAIAEVSCTLRTGLRRIRRYAVTGLDLRVARQLPGLDISLDSRESVLLLVLVDLGFDLPAARSFVASGISMDAIDQDLQLLEELAPWPPARLPEPRDLVAALLRAAGKSGLPFAEVMRRAQRLAAGRWPGPEPDLARVAADTFPGADRITEIFSPIAIGHWMENGVGPSSLAQQVSSIGWPLGKVLELLDELACLGITVPSREAYPAELGRDRAGRA